MDTFDQVAAPLCKAIIKEIDENPFLPYATKKYFTEGLQQCADKSIEDKSPEVDKELKFNSSVQEIGQKFFMHTGEKFERAKIVFRSIF